MNDIAGTRSPYPLIPLDRDVGLKAAITSLCAHVEALAPGSRTGVCIASADHKSLERAVFPALATFQDAIRDIPMGPPYFGSCTAAMDGRAVVTTHDMQKESRFDERFVAHCLSHGIRSLQSRPVFDAENKPMGTFVMGYGTPHAESEFDGALMEFAADVVKHLLQRT